MEEKKIIGKTIYSEELPKETLETIHRLHWRMVKEMCDACGVQAKDIHSEIKLTNVKNGVEVNEVFN